MARYRVIEVFRYHSKSVSNEFIVQKAYNIFFMTFWLDVQDAYFWKEEDAIRLVDELVELDNKPTKTIYTK